ncbi:MAG: zinc metallopeptidase [Firmicutes bacterium]|nr:zinc metallopeptidase [[Eubacterium] siraeum]MCM1488939.1 zinc metallopeptidase [Bacillota bacterium]
MLDYFTHNPTAAYVLVIAAVIFSYAVQASLNSTFKKYSRVYSRGNVPAHVIARQILDSYGLYGITVMRVDGSLTDHFDPKSNTVALSDSTFFSTSVAAIGVAAHECGHAVQHNSSYLPIKIRSMFVPIAQIGSKSWIILFFIGMFMGLGFLVDAGIILFGFVVLFQLLTLPVEFDASRRALKVISGQGLLEKDELAGAKKTLNAAAMTYVAALLTAVTQLIRLIAISNRRRN